MNTFYRNLGYISGVKRADLDPVTRAMLKRRMFEFEEDDEFERNLEDLELGDFDD